MESVAAVDLELVGVLNGGDGGRVDGGQSDRVHANVHPRWWCGRRWTFASIVAANVQPWFPAGRRWTFASIVAANIHRGSRTRSRRTFADRARRRSLGSVSLALPRRDSTTSIARVCAARLAGVQSAVHAGVVGVCGGRVHALAIDDARLSGPCVRGRGPFVSGRGPCVSGRPDRGASLSPLIPDCA